MELQSYSFRICCIGYTPVEHDLLTDYLTSTGMLLISPGEPADIILDGSTPDSDQIIRQVHENRLLHPSAVIIRCIPAERHDNNPYCVSSLFDGYLILDFSSVVWKENLLALINHALSTRHLLQISTGTGEKIYQQIFYTNAVPMILTTPETGLFVDVNEAFLHTFGYSREEVIGKSSVELNLFAKQTIRDEKEHLIVSNFPLRDVELELHTKEGSSITGLFSMDKIFRGNTELLLTTMKDISYLKEVERSLKEKNLFIQDILSSVSEGIIVYDLDLRYRVWNRYMEDLTGITESEVIGRPFSDYHPDLNGDDIKKLLTDAINGNISASADVRFHIPSTGKTGWVSIIYTPYRDISGKIIGAIGTFRNISGRKKAEEEVQVQKKLLRSIIDTVPVWIACFDVDRKILLANTTFSSALGVNPEDIEGHHFEEFCIGTHLEHHIILINRALSGREVPFDVQPGDNPDDLKKMYLRGRYSPLKNTEGTIIGVVAIIIDISDLSLAQKALEMINAKLNLLSSITRHDILNSLTGLLGYLSCTDDEKDYDLLMTYVKKAFYVATQIREQIEFTRDYQDLGVKEPVWQDANEVFNAATKGMKFGKIQVLVLLEGLFIFADPLLERVIFNLIDNALRYGGAISKISSSWYQHDNEVIWVIEDNGVGVQDEMKEKIFRKGIGQHTGLGLFLTREILDITGLQIRETGDFGAGARFEIHIPSGNYRFLKDESGEER